MERHVLHIDVDANKGTISWMLSVCTPDGGTKPMGGKRDQGFEISTISQNTIKLLAKLRQLLADLERSPGPHPEGIAQNVEALTEVLGENLYAALFVKNSDLTSKLNEELGNIDIQKLDLLRIELEFLDKDDGLASFPWEYLRHPTRGETGRFLLAKNTELVLSRTLYFKKAIATLRELRTSPPIRVLLVVASPSNKEQVIYKNVEEVLSKTPGIITLASLIEVDIDKLVDDKYKPRASWKAFEEYIQKSRNDDRPYHIIHFIGHGQRVKGKEDKLKGQLAFIGVNGQADWIDDETFADTVAKLMPDLKLVFLQACESALPDPHNRASGVALQLAYKNIPAVVAMQAEVESGVANQFAEGFYKALNDGSSIDLAVKMGRDAITSLSNDMQKLAFGIPVLYLHSYDSLVGEKKTTTQQTSTVSTEGQPTDIVITTPRLCPRCKKPIQRADQKLCTKCSLQLMCKCGVVYDDPLGEVCGECGDPVVVQPPWPNEPPAKPPAGPPSPGGGKEQQDQKLEEQRQFAEQQNLRKLFPSKLN